MTTIEPRGALIKTFKEKLELLSTWFSFLFQPIRKDLEEWLRKNPTFVMSYFPHFFKIDLTTIPLEILVQGFTRALQKENEEQGEDLAMNLSQFWILKHEKVYDVFENGFKVLGIDFENELLELSYQDSTFLISAPVSSFGALTTYVFCILNSVLLNKEAMAELKTKAKKDWELLQEQERERGKSADEAEAGLLAQKMQVSKPHYIL
jgi:hypothetical protein